MGLGGSFLDPPDPLEDPLEDALEENLEPPGFPPRRPPACFFFDLAFILTMMVQWLYGYIAVGGSNQSYIPINKAGTYKKGGHFIFQTYIFPYNEQRKCLSNISRRHSCISFIFTRSRNVNHSLTIFN